VYKLDSFVDFIGDEQLHALECYAGFVSPELKTLSLTAKDSIEQRGTVECAQYMSCNVGVTCLGVDVVVRDRVPKASSNIVEVIMLTALRV
jgi:hypothetical protein